MGTTNGTRRLGTSGLEVGPIAYGCWRFAESSPAVAEANLRTALDHGCNLIDTADIYGFDGAGGFGAAEELLGRILRSSPELRDRMVLATKGGIRPGVPYDWSDAYLRAAIEDSLWRLDVDRIDLYQLHRPDVLTHPEEVAAVLADLLERDLVASVGLSNVTPSQFELVQHFLDRPIATTQPEFSPWHPAPVLDGTFDQAIRRGVVPLAWSPLGGGRIGGDDEVTRVLDRLAHERGATRTAIALAWVLAHPAEPVPILGTQRADRITEAMGALEISLTRSEWYEVLQAGTGESLP
jgi:predicted oxidoreductase